MVSFKDILNGVPVISLAKKKSSIPALSSRSGETSRITRDKLPQDLPDPGRDSPAICIKKEADHFYQPLAVGRSGETRTHDLLHPMQAR
jgi:hypothetical protein